MSETQLLEYMLIWNAHTSNFKRTIVTIDAESNLANRANSVFNVIIGTKSFRTF